MAFYSRSDLVNHKMLHVDEKTVDCNVCGKIFTHNCDLLAHYTTHLTPDHAKPSFRMAPQLVVPK